MQNNLLNDSENKVKYQVVVNGTVLAVRGSVQLAESFVSQLTTEQQNNAQIVPVTNEGKQVLFS